MSDRRGGAGTPGTAGPSGTGDTSGPPTAALPLAAVDLRQVQAELRERHGELRDWWPGQTPFEIAVGAVLVQRSRWEQAQKALERLREEHLLEAAALAAVPEERLRELVRGAGFPRQKPRRLHALARWMRDRAPAAGALGDEDLRGELLAVEGIGEETADAISLYVFSRPAFLCDEYARRILRERGVEVPRGYAAFRRAIAPALARAAFTTAELAQLHGLIVEEGRHRSRRGTSPAHRSPGLRG